MRKLAIRIALLTALALSTLPAGDPARVYVYARRDTHARSWLPISCNDVVASELKQGAFFAITLEPGQWTLSPEKGVPLSIDVRAGEDAFVRLDWNFSVNRPPIPVFAHVREVDARHEMRFLSYVPAKKIHSDRVSKSDPSPQRPPQLHTRDPK
jgi:hypothetical protein